MEALENNFSHFDEFGGSKSEDKLNEKYIDNEDPQNQSKRGHRKRDQFQVPSLLPNLFLKWKQKWTSNPTKRKLMLVS
jgi:hypothetical protein